ncbi:hypothetical protein CVT25_005779 [Psilocybe cyanescens]|uniref:Uncharacterized protein n=1 Tax=Psilocybe cyanescens TaxID=93625 RepID=A0A409VLR7_PSICY|nr:hypothetical protein CVT25_005779 [Psilocybe cyanescens]
MPKASSRAPLPTSSSDFALPSSTSSSPGASSSSVTLDDPSFLFNRLRRSSLLQKSTFLGEPSRLHSPLASSFTLHARRRSQNTFISEESESDKDRMMTDSPNSSETHTPPLKLGGNSEEDLHSKLPVRQVPLTPPRRRSSASIDATDMPTIFNRRLSFPLKQPRILNLLAESRPDEIEIKSEAAFQKMVASVSELPAQPRTPRTLADRGRYPEEAGHDDSAREDTPSDDELELDDGPFAFSTPSGTQPINIMKPRTPAGSVAGSINGDEVASGFTAITFNGTQPDQSLEIYSTAHNKRFEDRFDPYPSCSKRRAISPSLQYLRDSHQQSNSPMSRGSSSRHPIAIPVSTSTASSTASSPTISSAYPPFPRGINITSSPTLRATMTMPSPILRPMGRRREEEEEREIEGAGEAVGSLTIG